MDRFDDSVVPDLASLARLWHETANTKHTKSIVIRSILVPYLEESIHENAEDVASSSEAFSTSFSWTDKIKIEDDLRYRVELIGQEGNGIPISPLHSRKSRSGPRNLIRFTSYGTGGYWRERRSGFQQSIAYRSLLQQTAVAGSGVFRLVSELLL